MPLLEAEFIDTGKVFYVVHSFNLGRPQTALAAEAAWCAHDQDKFFEYEHALYENQGQMALDQNSLINLATSVGLDEAEFAGCLSTGKNRQNTETARLAAMEKGVNSTPTFFINNKKVTGNLPMSDFRSLIEEELNRTQ